MMTAYQKVLIRRFESKDPRISICSCGQYFSNTYFHSAKKVNYPLEMCTTCRAAKNKQDFLEGKIKSGRRHRVSPDDGFTSQKRLNQKKLKEKMSSGRVGVCNRCSNLFVNKIFNFTQWVTSDICRPCKLQAKRGQS